MRAICLVMMALVCLSVYADPPKGRARKPKPKKTVVQSVIAADVAADPSLAVSEVVQPTIEKVPVEIPAGIVDPNFRREFAKADPFITAIINEHEAKFPGAMGYNHLNFYAQLNRLSYIQQGLVFELMQTEGYLEAFTNREPMTDLKVTVVAGEETEAKKFDDRVWKGLINYVQAKIGESENVLESKKEEVNAKTVFDRLMKSFYRAWNDSFYPEDSDRVMDQIIPLIVYGTVQKKFPDLSLSELKDTIAKLDVGALDYFQDKHSWEPLFEGSDAKIKRDKKDYREYLDQAMDRAHRKIGKDVYGKSLKISLRKGEVITIREVHPDIAMFRGYVGNDCATCFSPGFVFNPMDRYYYVYNNDGKILGYVGTTFVKIKGKKATLIHTIQGPGFSGATTEMVIRGFQAAQASLGSELTVLSGDRNIYENVNYMPIQDAMMGAVRGHKELSMKFEDSKFREIIGKWDSEMTYDDPKNNPYGREVTYNVKDVQVEVTQTPFDFNMSISSPEAIAAAEKSCELRMSWKRRGSDSTASEGAFYDFDW